MAQHDYVIANGTGAAVRSDLNNALAAIVSNNSGATEPATMYAYQWWADTSTGLLKLRNAANNAWITLRELDGTLTIEAGTVSAPGLAFASDLNTGVWSPGADQFAIGTNGVERVEWGTSEVVFNDGGANYDFRIEGDTNSSLFFVDASAEAVGIGTTSPAYPVTIFNATNNFLQFSKSGDAVVGSLVGRPNGAAELRLQNSENEPIAFLTNNTERARIDSSGRLLVGTSTSVQVYQGVTTFNSELQVAGSSASLTIARTVGSGNLFLARNQTVNDGSPLGVISFNGGDGTNLRQAAEISAVVDGTPGTGDMPGRLVFSTTADGASSPTERMRIANTGSTGIYSGSSGLLVGVTSSAGTSTPIMQAGHSASAMNTFTTSFYVWSNGNVQNTNNSYTAISDVKLKENIVDANSQWDDIKAFQVRNYNLKEGQTHKQIGLIAQEVEPISPGLVYESPDRDEDGNDLGTVTKSVNYSVLYMKAVKALQEAMERIEQLEAEMAAVKAQIS